jgi:hypothetical protein
VSNASWLVLIENLAVDDRSRGTTWNLILIKCLKSDIRFGSKADIAVRPINVCFTPKSGHSGRFWILLLMGKGAQLRGASPVKFPRRQFLHLAASAAALSAFCGGVLIFWL